MGFPGLYIKLLFLYRECPLSLWSYAISPSLKVSSVLVFCLPNQWDLFFLLKVSIKLVSFLMQFQLICVIAMQFWCIVNVGHILMIQNFSPQH